MRTRRLRLRRPQAARWTLLILSLAGLLLAACAASGSAPADSGSSAPGAAPSAPAADAARDQPAAFPLTLTDDAGRQVTIERRPERIVSLAPSNTEILFAVGAGERVVGVDTFSDHPGEVASLPRLGGLTDTNFEKIVELAPDLILTIGGTDEQVARLEELGITVLVIQPETFEDVLDRIRLIGRVVGEEQAAADLLAEMGARVDAVRRAVGDVPEAERPRVFYEVWHDPLMTVGPGGFIHDVIALAGGVNVFADADNPWPVVSLEAVVARDPQVIITTFQDSYDQLLARSRPGWDGISAVQQGRVYRIDQNLISRPGPRLVDALEQVARFLYPELLP